MVSFKNKWFTRYFLKLVILRNQYPFQHTIVCPQMTVKFPQVLKSEFGVSFS